MLRKSIVRVVGLVALLGSSSLYAIDSYESNNLKRHEIPVYLSAASDYHTGSQCIFPPALTCPTGYSLRARSLLERGGPGVDKEISTENLSHFMFDIAYDPSIGCNLLTNYSSYINSRLSAIKMGKPSVYLRILYYCQQKGQYI